MASLLHVHARQPEEVAVLNNVAREPMRTCRVGAAPVRGFKFCWRCAAHQRIAGVADVVAPLVYAVADTESAAVLSRYKNHLVRTLSVTGARQQSRTCCARRSFCTSSVSALRQACRYPCAR